MTRLFFVAGESSGDIHGANLIRALHALSPNLHCEGLGGRRMEEAGMHLHHDLAGEAIMGFAEVVRHIQPLRQLFKRTIARLDTHCPDALVLIDYPGFNIRLAKAAFKRDIPVVYYISPQIWAWKFRRVHELARTVAKMLVILPFERELYRQHGLDCDYVGHPLLDEIARTPLEGRYRDSLVVGLLPGSRKQEIARHLGPMLEVARGLQDRYPHARFVVPTVDAERETQVRAMSPAFPLETLVGRSYELLDGARFCLVASGTATVEAALFGVPMIIMYRTSPLTYWFARRLVRIPHIGMVNILAGRRIVPEFVQERATAEQMLPVALALMEDGATREAMVTALGEVQRLLGGPGASVRAAHAVLQVARGARHA